MSVFSKLSFWACLVAAATSKTLKRKDRNEKSKIEIVSKATTNGLSYEAAFVEHICVYDETSSVASIDEARVIIQANMDILSDDVAEASAAGAQIILLPEFALTGLVSEREQMRYYLETVGEVGLGADSTPCNNDEYSDRTTLQQLSCMASDNGVYLSVNYGDVLDCDSCDDGFEQYNTQIIFSDSGEMVAKYWKIHTFNEDEYDTAETMDYVTFEMNGIKFGLFTCYDSMFGTPIVPLLTQYDVSEMLISHWWVNDYPRMAAVSWFESVSRIYGVNLIVSSSGWLWENGWARPRHSSGSGIYHAGEVITEYYNDKESSDATDYSDKVIVATVPVLDGYTGKLSPVHQGVGGSVDQLPASMEYNSVWQYVASGATVDLTVTVPETDDSPEFTCTATGLVDEGEGDEVTRLVLYTATGYFPTPDGNDVYFYEQFCSLYLCMEAEDNANCWLTDYGVNSWDTSMYDESEISFEHLSMNANFEMNHVFPMALNGRGENVFDVMTYSTFTQDDSSATYGFDEFDQEYPYMLSLSMLGRDFTKDVRYVASTVVVAEESNTDALLTVPHSMARPSPKVHNGFQFFPNLSTVQIIVTFSVLSALIISFFIYAYRTKMFSKKVDTSESEYSSLL